MNGLTLYVCIGKYGGWRFGFDGPALRIVCGWLAIAIAARDIEQDIHTLLEAVNGRGDKNADKNGEGCIDT